MDLTALLKKLLTAFLLYFLMAFLYLSHSLDKLGEGEITR